MSAQITQPNPCFSLGQVVATPAALQALDGLELSPQILINRHVRGDWGDLGAEDLQANTNALSSGDRLLSAYHYEGTKFWVITECDRSSTTILLPEEY